MFLTIQSPCRQSCAGHRIAPVNPLKVISTIRYVSRKLRKIYREFDIASGHCGTCRTVHVFCQRYRADDMSDRVAGRLPVFGFGKLRNAKIKLFPTPEYTSKQASDPVVPQVPCTGIFLGPSKSGKTVAPTQARPLRTAPAHVPAHRRRLRPQPQVLRRAVRLQDQARRLALLAQPHHDLPGQVRLPGARQAREQQGVACQAVLHAVVRSRHLQRSAGRSASMRGGLPAAAAWILPRGRRASRPGVAQPQAPAAARSASTAVTCVRLRGGASRMRRARSPGPHRGWGGRCPPPMERPRPRAVQLAAAAADAVCRPPPCCRPTARSSRSR